MRLLFNILCEPSINDKKNKIQKPGNCTYQSFSHILRPLQSIRIRLKAKSINYNRLYDYSNRQSAIEIDFDISNTTFMVNMMTITVNVDSSNAQI